MSWKPKEKQLTAAEAIEQALKEFAPCWFNSKPILAGIRSGEQATAYPLDPDFDRQIWLIFFADITLFSGENFANFARKMNDRYFENGVKVIFAIKPVYPFIKDSKWITDWLKKNGIKSSAVLDLNMNLSTAFKMGDCGVLLIHEKKKLFESTDRESSLLLIEPAVQSHLRLNDPGLSLLNLYSPDGEIARSSTAVEFGKRSPSHFQSKILGHWKQDEDKIVTSDPNSEISFQSPGSRFSLVAEAMTQLAERCRITVEVNELPAPDVFAGRDLNMDEEGQTSLSLKEGGLYHALAGLNPRERRITLRFPTADQVPVALYGLRFAD